MPNDLDRQFMQRALVLAQCAFDQLEVPVGALVVRDGQVLGEGWNQPIGLCDATAHAEIQALRQASQHCRNYRLPGTTVYITIEPCVMCVGAMLHARVERIVFGALEPKAGALQSRLSLLDASHWNHTLSFEGGMMADAASDLMQRFFRMRREQRKAAKDQNPPPLAPS